MGMRQTQASCFCDMFICCNQSLLLPRLPNSCRDKEMDLCFQRLDDLHWRPSRGQVILIIFLSPGWDWEEVGLTTSYCSGGLGDLLESRVKLRALYCTCSCGLSSTPLAPAPNGVAFYGVKGGERGVLHFSLVCFPPSLSLSSQKQKRTRGKALGQAKF